MMDDGTPVNCVADYGEWVQIRFEEYLEAYTR
jgi:hypothetical protein